VYLSNASLSFMCFTLIKTCVCVCVRACVRACVWESEWWQMRTQSVPHITSNHKAHSVHTFIEIVWEAEIMLKGKRTWHSEQSFVVSNRPVLNLTGLFQTDIVWGGNPCVVFIDYVTKSAVQALRCSALLLSLLLYILCSSALASFMLISIWRSHYNYIA